MGGSWPKIIQHPLSSMYRETNGLGAFQVWETPTHTGMSHFTLLPCLFRPKLSPVPIVPVLTQTPFLATTDASALPRSIPAIQVIADGMGMVYGSQGLPFQNMDPNWWCSHHMARESTQGRIESTQLNQATQIASGHVHATADAPPFGAEQFVMNRHKPSRKIAGDPHIGQYRETTMSRLSHA